jgi:hypothetical protein
VLAALVLTAALGGGPPGAGARLHAHARWPYAGFLGKGNERVIRSGADLADAVPSKDGETRADVVKRAAADVARALKVKAIDWKTQMLVLIRVDKANPLYPVAVTGVTADGRALTVHYAFHAPVAARPQDRPPNPVTVSLMALVSRSDGPVRTQGNRYFPR